jgi:hypothetical protein
MLPNCDSQVKGEYVARMPVIKQIESATADSKREGLGKPIPPILPDDDGTAGRKDTTLSGRDQGVVPLASNSAEDRPVRYGPGSIQKLRASLGCTRKRLSQTHIPLWSRLAVRPVWLATKAVAIMVATTRVERGNDLEPYRRRPRFMPTGRAARGEARPVIDGVLRPAPGCRCSQGPCRSPKTASVECGLAPAPAP